MPKNQYVAEQWIQSLASYYFTVMYITSFVTFVTSIVSEKEKKMKEVMRMMGMMDSAFWYEKSVFLFYIENNIIFKDFVANYLFDTVYSTKYYLDHLSLFNILFQINSIIMFFFHTHRALFN
jgi:hypothetical protein